MEASAVQKSSSMYDKTEQVDSQSQKSESQSNSDSLTGALERLVEISKESDSDQTTVKDVTEGFGSRAYGPLLLIPAVIALFPITGGIPGMSIFTATIMILIAVQMMFSQGNIWLPNFISKRSISQDKLESMTESWKPWTKWFDKAFSSRLSFLTKAPFTYVIAILCIALALSMYPLAFVPMGAAPPSFAIMILALALTAQDGIMAIVGTVVTILCGWLTYVMINNSWDAVQEGLSWMGLM